MTLSDYLDGRDLNAFAETMGVHLSTVYRWKKGETLPGVKQIAAIEKKTKGKVRFRDFLKD